MNVVVTRKAHFNAAHRLHNPDWDASKNKKIFGLCNNENFHGHNYDLEVSICGPIDPATGYVIDMKLLKDIIEEEVISKFDHKNLNLDVPEFAKLNPTAENIVVVCYQKIKAKLPSNLSLQIKLFETERNAVSFPASF